MKKKTIDVKRIEWFDDRCYKIRYENDQKLEVEEFIPSVTTKLNVSPKPYLLKWYADLGYREARMRMFEAGERGSRVHWAWETYCSGGVVIYDPIKTPIYDNTEIEEIKKKYNQHFFMLRDQGEMWDFLKLQKFYQIVKPFFTMNEQTVFDLQYKDAGTTDNIFGIEAGKYFINGAKEVELEKGLYIFDAKTGSAVGDDAKMQVCAYWECVNYMKDNGMIELPPDLEIKGAIIGHTSALTRKGIAGFSAIVLDHKDKEMYYRRYRNISEVWLDNNPNFEPLIRELPGYIAL